ncbi:ROK family protein [Streptomyces albicerus]|uniref:ROK family protein n=1 Tax=Streptomyces albicerus TaxID=2569859 RepID=UPI00124B9AB1|nr:ROK family protein [Streptomyces albicerus]
MTVPAPDAAQTLCTLLDMVRAGAATTRPELIARSGFGRKLVTQRIADLLERGLLEEGELAPSTGGRSARQLRFRADAGRILVAELGSTSLSVGLADLDGNLLAHQEEPATASHGADTVLARVEELFDDLLAAQPHGGAPLWGIGIGLLGPVDALTGCAIPLDWLPSRGWGGYPVRKRLSARFDVPVWADNEVNLMALGEHRGTFRRSVDNLAYVKLGTGIGAGLVAGGHLIRGASGSAGELGHVSVIDDPSAVCWCGATGCLVLYAGGDSLATAADRAARSGESPVLAARLAAGGRVDARDLAEAAAAGDPYCVARLTRAGHLVGRALAALVNVANPSLVLIGGGVASSGDLLLAAIREEAYRLAFPSAAHDLRIDFSPLSDRAGLTGAAFMAVDELLSPSRLPRWIDAGSPAGLAAVVHG